MNGNPGRGYSMMVYGRSCSKDEITCLLKDWQAGSQEAQDLLIRAVYDELRKIARAHLRKDRYNHTLQPTELVNEAFIRLVEQKEIIWEDRLHFFGITAKLMRQILIEYLRKKRAAKRGGAEQDVKLDEVEEYLAEKRPVDLIELEEALVQLESIDARKSQLVELRYFAGLTLEETAKVLKVSVATVKREWILAKAWLYRYLSGSKRNDRQPSKVEKD
jgi:RNA polymerase sigma factor (TIGR02999 family)